MGLDGSMPWPSNKEDMMWFKSITLNQIVVMGKKTWDSKGMPKPLPNRTNIVFTHKKINVPNVQTISGNVCEQLNLLENQFQDKSIFVIGGSDILIQARPVVKKIFITRIPGNYYCDIILNVDQFIEGFTLTNKQILNTCIIEEYSIV